MMKMCNQGEASWTMSNACRTSRISKRRSGRGTVLRPKPKLDFEIVSDSKRVSFKRDKSIMKNTSEVEGFEL